MASQVVSQDVIDDLLAADAIGAQIARLDAAQLLHAEGLNALLDAADERIGTRPAQARLLSLLVAEAAQQLQLYAVAARASYLRAQVLAMQGDFAPAMALVDAARDGFMSQGLTLDAQRTVVGRMRILGEMGQFNDALQAGREALAALQEPATPLSSPPSPEWRLLNARVQQNCGICYRLTGRHEEALAAFEAAETHYQALNRTEELADIAVNRALVLKQLGRVRAALDAFDAAAQTYAQAHLPLFQAQAFINRGESLLLLSDYMQSLAAFAEAERLLSTEGVDDANELADQPILLRQLGDVYLALNLYGEASDAYQLAEAALGTRGLLHHHALCLWGLGMALYGQNRWTDAAQRLEQAATLFRTIGNTPRLVDVQLELAARLAAQNELAQAHTLVQEALTLAQGGNWAIQQIHAAIRHTDLLLMNDPPDLDASDAALRAVQPQVDLIDLPHLRYQFQQRLGHLARLQGDEEVAQAHLEEAVASIEQIRATLLQERMRASFLDDKMAAYQELVELHLDRYRRDDDIQHLYAAFTVVESAKSRALADLLTGVIMPQRDDALDDETVAQLQALQEQLDTLYAAAQDAHPTQDGATPSHDSGGQRRAAVNSRAAQLEYEMSRLRLQRMAAHRRPLPLGQSKKPEPMAMLLSLPDDLSLIVYHQVGQEFVAFVHTSGRQIQVVRGLGRVQELHSLVTRLEAQWQRFRAGGDFLEQHMPLLEESTRRILRLIHEQILAPILGLLDAMPTPEHAPPALRKLVIIPHGMLHRVPFHALYDGMRYMAEKYAISYAPSVTVFDLCRQRQVRLRGNALVVGVADEHIPGAAIEVDTISTQLQRQGMTVQRLVNIEALRVRLPELAAHSHLIHLACHGLFRGDNPMFSALRFYDGWYTAAEAAQLSLRNGLVTLSACESGRSQVLNSEESVGLSYAFLSAGAATLLVSQWLVQDASTALLMQEWYDQLMNSATNPVDLAEALRKAQLAVKAQYPHPYYWAPFILVGQRTGD